MIELINDYAKVCTISHLCRFWFARDLGSNIFNIICSMHFCSAITYTQRPTHCLLLHHDYHTDRAHTR